MWALNVPAIACLLHPERSERTADRQKDTVVISSSYNRENLSKFDVNTCQQIRFADLQGAPLPASRWKHQKKPFKPWWISQRTVDWGRLWMAMDGGVTWWYQVYWWSVQPGTGSRSAQDATSSAVSCCSAIWGGEHPVELGSTWFNHIQSGATGMPEKSENKIIDDLKMHGWQLNSVEFQGSRKSINVKGTA